MTKSTTILIASIFVVGCSAVRKSPTWDRVVKMPRGNVDSRDRSGSYAASLHKELQAAKVPHRVVTYNYPFRSKFDGTGTAQRTSVIYNDPTSGENPWWLMDELLTKPVWLPSEPVQKQISFFLRRPAKVVTLRDYTGADHKTVVPTEKPAAKARLATAPEIVPTVEIPRKPWMITRAWRKVVSIFTIRPVATTPVVEQPQTPVFEKPAPVVAPEPQAPVAQGPRPLFRPAGVKLRPFFASNSES